MLSVICFSKDRPMQIDAYIQSLRFCSGIAEQNIHVIYKASDAFPYDRVIARHPDVNWVAETDFTLDLLTLLARSERYVLLGCDDVIFHGVFDPSVAIGVLERERDTFGFSLRLGLNLHSLPDLRKEEETLRWSWRQAPTGHWSYPWDVSASIYRREFIQGVLVAFDGIANPNRLESFFAESLAAGTSDGAPLLAAFAASKTVTLTINRVQNEYPNDFDASKETSPEQLYEAYVGGQEIDWPKFFGKTYRRVHIDSDDFNLTNQPVIPVIEIAHLSDGARIGRWSGNSLAGRIIFWKFANRLKEFVRHFMPRPVIALLRKAL